MKLTRTFPLELGARKADGKRTYSAVLSTDTPVKRRDWDGEFLEVLSHAQGAVDLSRTPLPLLESHDQRTLPIGIVDNVRIVDGKLRGDVTFGTSARAQEVAADVDAGIIRNLSVGYSIEKTVEKVDGKKRTITATRWTPHEASAVAIGADAGAGFGRSATMGDENQNETATTPTPDPIAVERTRAAEIITLASRYSLGDGWARAQIDSGAALEAVRADVLRELARRDDEFVTDGAVRIEEDGFAATRTRREPGFLTRSRVTSGDSTTRDFRAAAVDAILLRAGVRVAKPHPGARDVPGSIIDIARICLSRAGQTVRGGNEALIKRFMTTSDFPAILLDAMHKATRNGYETEPASHRAWVRPQAVPDFRDQHRVILGSAPALAQVNEGGEYTNGSLNDDATSYRVAKYGKIVSLTWETLVNDSLGAFMRIQPAMGQAARRLEADTVYNLFTLNAGAGPTMQDAVALFHANHANLGTAAAFDADALGAARALLRKQTALGGGYLSLVPRYLIIPVELEQAAEVLVAQATRAVTTVDSATPQWIAALEIVVEPRLADDAFYLAADASQIDTCELGLLEENQDGPMITEDRSQEFRNDIIAWKVRHVLGAKFLDWRGIVKQPVT